MNGRIAAVVMVVVAAGWFALTDHLPAQRGQGGRGDGAAPPPTPQAAALIDVTGYWVSLIVDEWRFRVSPQKGDILYLPLNNDARQLAKEWDTAKDEADGRQSKACGAVGVRRRSGRFR